MIDDATLVAGLSTLDSSRMRGYRESLAFFQGVQWRDPSGRSPERRLVLNYARALVEKVTSYLLADRSFVVDAEDESAAEHDRARLAEAALIQISDDNGLEHLDYATELDAAVLGDGAYRVTWDAAVGQVRVTAPDVQGLYAWRTPNGAVERLVCRYQQQGEDVIEVWTDATFSLFRDGKADTRVANPYSVIPFVVFPNLSQPKHFWGVSDLAAIIEPARELNRAFSQLSRILEISGNPIAVLENVDEAEHIAIGPGAVWEVPERAKAYVLDLLAGGGVTLHVEYINALYRVLHDLAETPRTAFGDNSRALAGVALEIELQPLIQKVMRKRLLRTPAYRRRNALILRLLDQFTGTHFAPHRSRVIWGAVLPRDSSRLLADEQTAITSGIRSRRTAMSRLGAADPDRELTRWLEEERLVTVSQRPERYERYDRREDNKDSEHTEKEE